MKAKTIALVCTCLVLSSCSSWFEDLTEAEILLKSRDYVGAAKLLESKQGLAAKRLLAQVHFNQAMDILHDLEQPQVQRYQAAQDLFAQSLKLDPKNKQARIYMRMLIKTQVKEGMGV